MRTLLLGLAVTAILAAQTPAPNPEEALKRFNDSLDHPFRPTRAARLAAASLVVQPRLGPQVVIETRVSEPCAIPLLETGAAKGFHSAMPVFKPGAPLKGDVVDPGPVCPLPEYK
jgi:hypothetical protein